MGSRRHRNTKAGAASNAAATEDGSRDYSAAVVNDLMKAQREIFATLTKSSSSSSSSLLPLSTVTPTKGTVPTASSTTDDGHAHPPPHPHDLEPLALNDMNRLESFVIP